jgi:hypothetical protein
LHPARLCSLLLVVKRDCARAESDAVTYLAESVRELLVYVYVQLAL